MTQRTNNLTEMYVLTDPIAGNGGAPGQCVIDDMAWIAQRALHAEIAIVAIDGNVRGWLTRQVGTATDGTVADLAMDRVAALVSPVLAADAGFAFYVAVPLRDATGDRIGTLAMLGRAVRAVSEDELTTLRKLASVIERLL